MENPVTKFTAVGDIRKILSTTLGISENGLTDDEIATKVWPPQRERPPEQLQTDSDHELKSAQAGLTEGDEDRNWEGEIGLSG